MSKLSNWKSFIETTVTSEYINVKFVDGKYQLSQEFPEFVGITSTGSGTISPINPSFVFYKNSIVD